MRRGRRTKHDMLVVAPSVQVALFLRHRPWPAGHGFPPHRVSRAAVSYRHPGMEWFMLNHPIGLPPTTATPIEHSMGLVETQESPGPEARPKHPDPAHAGASPRSRIVPHGNEPAALAVPIRVVNRIAVIKKRFMALPPKVCRF